MMAYLVVRRAPSKKLEKSFKKMKKTVDKWSWF